MGYPFFSSIQNTISPNTLGKAGTKMSRYNNPRSKRKQKQRAKRMAAEMCTFHNKRQLDESQDAPWCVSPEEFARRELKTSFTAQESTVIKRKRKHYEPKQLTAVA